MKKMIFSRISGAFTCRVTVLIFVALVYTGNVYSQQTANSQSESPKTQWGLKVGLNISSLSISNDNLSKHFDSKVGGVAGLTFARQVANIGEGISVHIHSGVEMSMKGFEFEANRDDIKCTAVYALVPATAGIQLELRKVAFEIRTGFYMAYGVFGDTKFSNSSDNMKTFGDDILKRFDAGMLVGFYCYHKRFVFGTHGEFGFLKPNGDKFTITGAKAHNSNGSFTIGYLF